MYEYEKNHIKALRKYLSECTVLLKSNGDFPLSEAGEIALYGSGARHTLKGGTGSGEVNSRYYVTVEKGLEKDGFTITTKEWMDAYDQVLVKAKEQFVKDIKARAKEKHTNPTMEGMGAVMPEPEYDLPLNGKGQVAVYVLSRICGEGNDRQPVEGDILLSETEKRDILTLNKTYDKFMLVLNVGGPVDLTPLAEIENILILSQLGVETGYALGHILLGKQNPSGKLTTTWSSWGDYCRIGEFGDPDETRYKEGIYVGYRYFDTVGKQAMYPFGYGLSYSAFSVEEDQVLLEGQQVKVTARVTNIGSYAGKEVVQVYVSAPQGKLDKPYQSLAGFAKTKKLLPGESQKVTVSFRMSDQASYDEETSAWILETGAYILHLGNSSVNTVICGAVILEENVTVLQAKKVFGKPDFEDYRPENVPVCVVPEKAPVLILDPAAIPQGKVDYDQKEEVDPFIAKLTNEQLAYINTGAFNPKGGLASVIGSASMSVAGAAGETAGILKDQGFPTLVMADGPAGLRLARKYFEDEKGIHGMGPSMPESVTMFLPKIVSGIMNQMGPKPKKGVPVQYQYATAIPIGTAIAQSWNPDFAEVCGDIVGDEMERMGVHLWLAPALNIHRSILCGRNFEYYSEDPLVSGIFAAGITRGVQKHPGRATTIKHYAANNQEVNRYQNNSQVSERAMREIYLRGFGICVRESQPHALMTSYNLLNGTHTSESRELTMDVLRSEFGYKGIVMTDWVISMMKSKASAHPMACSWKTAKAGGDLFMPGSKADMEGILKALADGDLTREQLMINATRVYHMALKLTKEQ